MYKIMKDIVTEKDIGKSKYEEIFQPFKEELHNLCVEYAKKKYDLYIKQMKMMTKMKERVGTSFMDDEYIKGIKEALTEELEPYLKSMNAL